MSAGPLATHNRNGARLCDRVGCRRHRRLFFAFGGRFCHRHCREVGAIRADVLRAKETGDRELELLARSRNAAIRKRISPGHMAWMLELELEHEVRG